MSSNITAAILETFNSLNDKFQSDTAATGSGDMQANWPAGNKEFPMLIRNITINPDATFWMGKGIEALPCVGIEFDLETVPDTNAADYNPDTDKAIRFTSSGISIVAEQLLTGALADKSKGKGWIIANSRERLKGYTSAILGDASDGMGLGDQMVAMIEKIQSEEALHARIYIDSYETKNAQTGEVTGVRKTDFCRGLIEVI